MTYNFQNYLPAVLGGEVAGGSGGFGGGYNAPQSGSAASIKPSQSSSKPLLQVAAVSALLEFRQMDTTAEVPSVVSCSWRVVRPDTGS